MKYTPKVRQKNFWGVLFMSKHTFEELQRSRGIGRNWEFHHTSYPKAPQVLIESPGYFLSLRFDDKCLSLSLSTKKQ